MLKPKEIAEISLVLWYLPLEQVEKIKRLVLELKQQHGYDEPVDDSDEWTEEDKHDARITSLRHAEATIPHDEDEADVAGDVNPGPHKENKGDQSQYSTRHGRNLRAIEIDPPTSRR